MTSLRHRPGATGLFELTSAGILYLQSFITRGDLRANPDRLYVFGDNMQQRGLGGQAKEMRGEPNSFGIPTKWSPSTSPQAFFKDQDWAKDAVRLTIIASFDKLEALLLAGVPIVFPSSGVGTGLSELPARAPQIYAYIESRIADLKMVALETVHL